MRCYIAILLSSLALNCAAQKNAWPGFPPPSYKQDVRGKFQPQHMGGAIRAIFQAKNGDYWIGSDAEGLYRYNGSRLEHLTTSDGLTGNQVTSIQEDRQGRIWIQTSRGICRYDGSLFIPVTPGDDGRETTPWDYTAQNNTDDLLFSAHDGFHRFDGVSLKYIPLPQDDAKHGHKTDSRYEASEYAVYCVYKDKAGIIWIGTQTKGVCRYDGKTFTWLNEKGLTGPAVRAAFQDHKGDLWFGNNGAGLFRYDGHTVTNVTDQHHLGNPQFLTSKTVVDKPGTLARIWHITEDSRGHLWIATIDAGAWEYDGKKFTNYTTKNGLNGDVVYTIYKDGEGTLWFGTDKGLCRYKNGKFSAAPF